MSTWRCPHCGTPQAETSRCWVCSRSPLTCRTCRHFRRAVVGRLGYCAVGRARPALIGDEIRACWQALPGEPEPYPGLFRDLVPLPAPTGLVPIVRSSGPAREATTVHHEESRGSGGQDGVGGPPVRGTAGVPAEREFGRPIPAAVPVPGAGRLVEAPMVMPSRRLPSTAER